MRLSAPGLLVLLLLMLAAAFLFALLSGPVSISLKDLSRWLFGAEELAAQTRAIIESIRLPRALLAVLVGACLAMSGAVMQGLFRNPLADPSLIGVTAGASLGASLMIVTSAGVIASTTVAGLSLVAVGAFIGALLASLLVYRLAASPSGTSVATMLLVGIAITALAGAMSSLLEYLSDNAMLRRISMWRMGGLDGASWPRVGIAALTLGSVLLLLPRYATALNAFLLGESEARHLGIDVERVKRHIIALVAVAVAVSVAVSGPIAFVGLVVPHTMRLLVGPEHRRLLPVSALAGAVLLLLADSVSRIALAPAELPVGIITAVLGAPFFVVLLLTRREYGLHGF